MQVGPHAGRRINLDGVAAEAAQSRSSDHQAGAAEPSRPTPATGSVPVLKGVHNRRARRHQHAVASGHERLQGGSGNDTLYGSGSSHLIEGTGNSVLTGDGFAEAPDALTGRCGNGILQGYMGNNVLTGSSGHDRPIAGAGNDMLNAGRGISFRVAGFGNTTMYGVSAASPILATHVPRQDQLDHPCSAYVRTNRADQIPLCPEGHNAAARACQPSRTRHLRTGCFNRGTS